MMYKSITFCGLCIILAACGGEPDEAQHGPYDGGVSTQYEYDALGRLVVYKVDGGVHTEYCLDAAGNRNVVSDSETGCAEL